MDKLNADNRKPLDLSSHVTPAPQPPAADDELPTPVHAVAALARAAKAGPDETARVRALVQARYPDLPSSRGKGGSATAQANRTKGGS